MKNFLFKIILGICFVFFSSYLKAYTITQQSLKNHVIFLTSYNLQGRLAGSPGEKKATEYVAEIFQQLDFLPLGDNGTFFQNFHKGRNVLAQLKVTNDNNAPLLIIGAHIDHLGLGENKKKCLHPGADDNASGVATLLEAAAFLKDLKTQEKLAGNKDILFVIWSGEESGLLGSTYFIKNFVKLTRKSSSSKIVYINLDMVGRFKKNLIIQGVHSSKQWKNLVAKTQEKNAISLIMQNDPYLPTDSLSFYLRRIPAINFFTGAHSDYHSPNDEWYKLNFAGMKNISEFLVDLVLTIESEKIPIEYQAVKKRGELGKRHFKVYLGTIPDYTYENAGVKLAGVIKNSPADRAGLKEEDILIQFANHTIQNLYDYSNAIQSLHPGDQVSVIVLRAHKTLVLTVFPQSRA